MKIILLCVFYILMIGTVYAEQAISSEQQRYCNYLKNEWETNCSIFKKVSFKKPKELHIVTGCDGVGLKCGRTVSFYTKLRNGNCGQGIKSVMVDERWTENVDKQTLSRVYWNKGKFVYEAVVIKSDNFEFSTEKYKFDESMGKARAWFTCAVK